MAWLWVLISAVWIVSFVLWIKNVITDIKLKKDYKFSMLMAFISIAWVLLSTCTALEKLGVI